MVDCWASKCEALSSVPGTTQTGCKPIIPERDNLRRERQGSQIQSHFQLHQGFLLMLRPSLEETVPWQCSNCFYYYCMTCRWARAMGVSRTKDNGWSRFSASTFNLVPGTGLRPPGLHRGHSERLDHLTSPFSVFFETKNFN